MTEYLRVLVGGVPVWQNCLLLTQRRHNAAYLPNQWQFVAGHVEPDENLASALTREIFEEVMLEIQNPKIIGTCEWSYKNVRHLQVNYLVNLKNNNAMKTKEIQDFKWMNIHSPEINDMLDDFNKKIYNQALSAIPFQKEEIFHG